MSRSQGKIIIGLLVVVIVLLAVLLGYQFRDKLGIQKGLNKPDYQYYANQFTEDDLSLFDKKTGKRISYGMTKEKLDDLLGTPTEVESSLFKYPLSSYTYPDGLEIIYRLDRVISLRITPASIDRYVTMRNIGLSNNPADPLVAYGGLPTIQGINADSYLFRHSNGMFNKLVENNTTFEDSLSTYLIDFSKENDKLVLITLTDMQFAIYLM